MASALSVLNTVNFIQKIREFCNYHEWILNQIDSKSAKLRFQAPSGNTQTLYILRYEDTVEFSVPSGLAFDNLSEVNGDISTYLLNRNAQRKFGFWCLEKIQEKFVISVMHNAPISLIDVNYFGMISQALVAECDQFELKIAQILNS